MQEKRVYDLAFWQNSKVLHVPAKILQEFKPIQCSFPLAILSFFLELLFCYAVAMFFLRSRLISALGKSRSVDTGSFYINLGGIFRFFWIRIVIQM